MQVFGLVVACLVVTASGTIQKPFLEGPGTSSSLSRNSVGIMKEKMNLRASQHAELTSFLEVNIDPRAEALLPWDRIRLTAASCQEGPTYSRSEPPNMELITDREQCGVCSRIVKNANRWNWKKHYSSLCVGVPRHLLGLCKHWACKMSVHCPEFIGNKCIVDGYERMPCPKKYLCWNCLGIPKKAVAGCFDGDGGKK